MKSDIVDQKVGMIDTWNEGFIAHRWRMRACPWEAVGFSFEQELCTWEWRVMYMDVD